MDRTFGVTIAILLVSIPLSPAAAGLADGEISVLGETASGDYGTGLESDAQWLTMRFVTGDDLQFRVDLSMVRVGVVSAVSLTSVGPTTTGGGGTQRGYGQGGSRTLAATSAGLDGSATTSQLLEQDHAGLGDLYLAASKRVVGGGVKLFRFDANLEVKVPTADSDESLGTGQWDFRLGAAGEYRFWSATVYGGLGWNKLGDPDWVEFQDVGDAYVGIESNPIFRERFVVSGWLEGWQEAIDSAGHRAALGVGLHSTGKVRWRLQLRGGLTDATADLAVLVGVSFGVAPPGPGLRGPQT